MLKGFKDFVSRGNVVDFAVAVVMGAAITTVVNALVEGFINPLVAAIFGEPDLSGVGNFTLNGAQFQLGTILDAALNFVIVAAAIYFFIVIPITKFQERRGAASEEEPAEDITLLREIRDELRARR